MTVPVVVPMMEVMDPPCVPPRVKPKVAPVIVLALVTAMVPLPPTIELALPNVTKPAYEAAPPLFMIAPPELTPVPLIVRASRFVMVWPLRSNAALAATVVPAATVPKAVALPRRSVPAFMEVVPVYELLPESVSTLLPAWVTLPDPEMALETLRSFERLKINEPLLVTELLPKVPVVPPSPICKVPTEMVVVVEALLAPLRVMVLAPVLVKANAPVIAPLRV